MDLHPSQEIIAADDHDFRVVSCGRQFGKTTLAVEEMLACAFAKGGRKVRYFATTFDQARNIAWAILIDKTKSIRVKDPNQSRLELLIHTQDGGISEITLAGFENIETARGQQFDLLVIDEVAYMKNWRYAWEAILEPTLAFRRGKALFISTPQGFNFFYHMYMRGQLDNPYWKSWRFTSYDNPFLPTERIDQARAESEPNYFAQEYLADFNKPEGVVYKQWDMDKQYIPLVYDATLPVHITWDFGINDATAIIIMQRYGKEIRVIDYYEAGDANLKHFTDWIDARPYKRAELETGDIAGRQRSIITGKSVIAEARNLGHPIRTMPIPDIPSQIRHAHRSIPYLFINKAQPNTERLVECLLNYKYPKKAETLINQSNELPIHDEFSHAMRAFEYYCWNIIPKGIGGYKQNRAGANEEKKTAFFHPVNDRGQLLSLELDKFK